MKSILRKAHLRAYRLAVGSVYLLCYPYLRFLSTSPRRYYRLAIMRRRIARVSAWLAGIRFSVQFEAPVDWSRPYIICANHSSSLDIPAICVLVKANCSFMGKEELAEGAVTRLFFRTIDVPVRRESSVSAYRAFGQAAEKLKAGVSMIIFPEGGIADVHPPQLQPFKNGPFKLAIREGVAVLPVTIRDCWRLMWDDGLKFGSKPGISHIFVHRPVETHGLAAADMEKLREQIRTTIQEKLEAYDH